MSTLEALGWNDWFAEQAKLHGDPAWSLARVAAVDRGELLLLDPAGPFRAKLSGRFMHKSGSAVERACVGDWVCVEKAAGDALASVHALLPRKTSLRRKAIGKSAEVQMIATNMDYAIVVQACDYDFNLKRLERYLVMIADGGASPCILLTKTDLVAPEVLADQIAQIRGAGIDSPVWTSSKVTGAGIDEVKRVLAPGKTYCFVGSSGVGKSTIINTLIGREQLDTKSVSGTGEGRHTTVRRELIVLENGALVIDNPGMREFGVLAEEGGIEGGFADILALAAQCRFRDCTHASEPGCAVIAAVNAGGVPREHYENFRKLSQESTFNTMTRAQKRQKDRAFGKHVKSVTKDLKKH